MLRYLLACLICLATSPSLHAQSWSTAISRNPSAGTAIIYRYIETFSKGFSRASQPVRIIITWEYTGTNGMPSLDERARMDDLEDSLQPLEKDGFASLALVSTGDNLKEWTYYAKEEKAFESRLNLALRSKPAFPIKIHICADAAWTTYEKFKRSVKPRP